MPSSRMREDSPHSDRTTKDSRNTDEGPNDLNLPMYCPCGHEPSLFDPKTMSCLLCLLVAAERQVAALKADLNTAHDRLAELEAEVLSERDSYCSASAQLSLTKELIASLETTITAREDALAEAVASHEEITSAHSYRCRKLQDEITLLRIDKDYTLQLLKDAQNESDRLRSALDSEGQRRHAALEELRSKATYLENDNAALTSEREALRDRCSLLDSHLATMTAQYESASISAINLECQLEETTQKLQDEIRDKDADITYLVDTLHGRARLADVGRSCGLSSTPPVDQTTPSSATLDAPNPVLLVFETMASTRLLGSSDASLQYPLLRESCNVRVHHSMEMDALQGHTVLPPDPDGSSTIDFAGAIDGISPSSALVESDSTEPFRTASLGGPGFPASEFMVQSVSSSVSGNDPGTTSHVIPVLCSQHRADSRASAPCDQADPRRHSPVLDLDALHVYLRVMMCAWWTEVRRYFGRSRPPWTS
ncbi:hypothetical protein L226DRAFT_574406 [Lentinus tigrinus ALCF2SS1-7]|uniref:Uncharacterized protein n=1 Tax=Lentinus tigrinus ALCF2SS1-6 TaxID=1328759 RepID=A0A5C2S9E7_9APHY|nr:hypothetical protein L227DRAFT_611371 [Lentinus tigrinus ALCF2SS1-6]RPD70969.1 hypothetical protein L226DRAFT_574406 [Lentinus tigrinus ALCF2SS1-7]